LKPDCQIICLRLIWFCDANWSSKTLKLSIMHQIDNLVLSDESFN